jgi:hypothetical protein
MNSPSTLDLVGRLEDLRVLLSRVTAELTHARGQAAALRVENRRLRDENARLQVAGATISPSPRCASAPTTAPS